MTWTCSENGWRKSRIRIKASSGCTSWARLRCPYMKWFRATFLKRVIYSLLLMSDRTNSSSSLTMRTSKIWGFQVSRMERYNGPEGITLVEGPNEAGKTSLGEAIGLLFEYPDSSKHRNVEAVKPVHRDEGPAIELEAESGPYAFIYFKRFYRKPETRLTISRPKPENRTGREAHELAEAILRETLDVDLWKALMIPQGEAIHQPDLTKQTSLSAALDKVAGGRSADPREESLFDRVREEYGRYFTERGAEKKELQEARKLQADMEGEVSKIENQLRDLEQ